MTKKIILGSGSPRRYELLRSIWQGEIEVVKSDVEEIYPADLSLVKIPIYLAKLKAEDIKSKLNFNESILITADTIVICENRVLGKPRNEEDAKAMLNFLSNKIHQVITGLAVFHQDKYFEIEEKTDVHFGRLEEEDIRFYLENYNPLDKAGSYGIQDFIGMIGIEKINGCYYNVMGLPTSRLYKLLLKF